MMAKNSMQVTAQPWCFVAGIETTTMSQNLPFAQQVTSGHTA